MLRHIQANAISFQVCNECFDSHIASSTTGTLQGLALPLPLRGDTYKVISDRKTSHAPECELCGTWSITTPGWTDTKFWWVRVRKVDAPTSTTAELTSDPEIIVLKTRIKVLEQQVGMLLDHYVRSDTRTID